MIILAKRVKGMIWKFAHFIFYKTALFFIGLSLILHTDQLPDLYFNKLFEESYWFNISYSVNRLFKYRDKYRLFESLKEIFTFCLVILLMISFPRI
jgi:hypothetical protein